MPLDNSENTLDRFQMQNTNDPTSKNNPRETLEMDHIPCSPKGHQFKLQNCFDIGSERKEKSGKAKDHLGVAR